MSPSSSLRRQSNRWRQQHCISLLLVSLSVSAGNSAGGLDGVHADVVAGHATVNSHQRRLRAQTSPSPPRPAPPSPAPTTPGTPCTDVRLYASQGGPEVSFITGPVYAGAAGQVVGNATMTVNDVADVLNITLVRNAASPDWSDSDALWEVWDSIASLNASIDVSRVGTQRGWAISGELFSRLQPAYCPGVCLVCFTSCTLLCAPRLSWDPVL